MIAKEQIEALIELNNKIIELLEETSSKDLSVIESVAEARGIAVGVAGYLKAESILNNDK